MITADTRRRWSRQEKRAIVAEAAQMTTSVSAVARRHGIAPSLLFRWRREFAEADGCGDLATSPRFIPIALAAPADGSHAPGCAKPVTCAGGGRSGLIEIELAGGRRVRVDGAVDTGVLKRVIDALEGR
ncbi:MAG: transposase [Hyphomicrobiales bacterium]|nr:transposase [Hyphomicrobiales bacterium]